MTDGRDVTYIRNPPAKVIPHVRSLGSKLGLVMLTVMFSVTLGTMSPAGAGAKSSPPPDADLGVQLSRGLGSATPGAQGRFARKHGFPTSRTAGVPRGWTPARTVNGDVTVDRAGAVLHDVRILGDLVIAAPNVTVRRVEVVGGVVENWRGSECYSGLKVSRTTIRRAPDQVTTGDFPALSSGGYTARRVAIIGLSEGFRVGGKEECGPVKIVNSFAKVVSPDECGDWHGDALQGYDGGQLTLRNSVLKLIERDGCGGTAPFFYPADQGNSSVSIDGLLVSGGGYSFRLGMPGTVKNLHIEQGEFYYGPIDVRCSALSSWDADIADLKGGQPVAVKNQRCNSDGGY